MCQPASPEELHERLLANDHTAQAEIALRLFVQIRDELQRNSPGRRDDDLANQAAVEAFASYFKRPGQYDPAKGKLASYLRMSALGDLKNAQRTERDLREKYRTGVELSQFAGNEEGEGDVSLTGLQAEELREEIRGLFPDERDWRMAELVIDQERRTEPFAEILEIQHLPLAEQRSEVKRHKDRIKQKLRRYGESIRDNLEPE
jgi:hypothetical protein